MGLFDGTQWQRPVLCETCGKLAAECECPAPAPARLAPEKQTARLAIEKRAKGKMVTVVRGLGAADNDLPDPTARKCYIGTHNYRAGRAAGDLVKKAIPKGGEVAIFVGQMDASNAIERRQGVLDVLAGKDRTEMGEITPNK